MSVVQLGISNEVTAKDATVLSLDCFELPPAVGAGQPLDVDRVLSAHPNPAIIAAVHAETSTGVRSDIAALGAGKGDALLLVDAVTSIAGIELEADAWGIDIGYAGTQKCLGVAPGLAPFTISDRAFERRVERPRSWYLDLGLLGGYVGEAGGSTGRTYHHTAPVAMVRSLTGRSPAAYVGDSALPDQVRTRTLGEETHRVFRARVVNPRWIAAMRRHGSYRRRSVSAVHCRWRYSIATARLKYGQSISLAVIRSAFSPGGHPIRCARAARARSISVRPIPPTRP